jgi:hypothetical protein
MCVILLESTPSKIELSKTILQSLVELTTLRALGVDSLPDWKITGNRERFVPVTRAGKHKLIEAELARMQANAELTGGKLESMHLSSVAA